ncbi:MAG: hypothetical protein KF822_09485 [Steroidobacteraceae bacterium]|nr:hypothetical protein [Steroidobacteraceae bacterium]
MNRTGTQVITRALRLARVLGADQSASSVQLSDGLLSLQAMLDEWRADSQLHDGTTWVIPTFADVATPVALPDGLTDSVECSMAVRLASENGTEVPAWVHVAAARGLRRWRAKVAASQVPELNQEVAYVVGASGNYNIYAS